MTLMFLRIGTAPSDPADPTGGTPWPWPNVPPHPSACSHPQPTGDDMPVPDSGTLPRWVRWLARTAIVASGLVFLAFADTPPMYAVAAALGVCTLVQFASGVREALATNARRDPVWPGLRNGGHDPARFTRRAVRCLLKLLGRTGRRGGPIPVAASPGS